MRYLFSSVREHEYKFKYRECATALIQLAALISAQKVTKHIAVSHSRRMANMVHSKLNTFGKFQLELGEYYSHSSLKSKNHHSNRIPYSCSVWKYQLSLSL